MSIEKWIDDLAAVAGSVKAHNSGQVKAFRVYARAEIPEAISSFPCALTYPVRVRPSYSDSGPCTDLWEGQTEFHLFPDVKKANLPEVMRYFAKIRNAFALKRTLGGKVAHLAIREDGMVMATAKYGEEDEHHAIMVYWEVKEIVTGEVTLGM